MSRLSNIHGLEHDLLLDLERLGLLARSAIVNAIAFSFEEIHCFNTRSLKF